MKRPTNKDSSIKIMINSDLRARFIDALDADGRTATDVLSQAIKTYIVGGEISERFIAMQAEIDKLKDQRRRLDSRVYVLQKYLYRIMRALATGATLQLNGAEIDALEFEVNNPNPEEVKKPEENPGNKRVARPKRKRGRPRKEEPLLKELEKKTRIDTEKTTNTEMKGENQNEVSERTN